MLLPPIPLSLLALTLSLAWPSFGKSTLGERRLKELSAGSVSSLVSEPDPVKNLDLENPYSHLNKILIPRAPGTDNNTLVREYLVSTLQALNWDVEEDTFEDNTPIGRVSFTNVIATKDPRASRRVVLSAHFDSKYFKSYPDNQFVGATDSAASCAMMLDIAEALNVLLEERQQRILDGEEDDAEDTTLQLIFFDGEEAFVSWTEVDSTYGARHLAEKWSSTYISPYEKRRLVLGPQTTELSTIEHLILLDLLGAPDPSIRSYFKDTAWLYDSLVSVERRLGESGLFEFGGEGNMAADKWRSYFRPRTASDKNQLGMGDDHVPFLKRGVNILHLIANPFPRVWHRLEDDGSALDLPTMRRWNIMLRVFLSEYLNLQPEDASSTAVRRSHSEL